MSEYDGLVYDLEEATYHSIPALGSTAAKKMIKSAATHKDYI